MVQQHFGLVEELSGAQNMLLGHPHGRAITDTRKAGEKLREVGASLDLEVDPERRVGDLTVGERQHLEILIALSAAPTVLIMDEPTAALGGAEIDNLGRVLRRLADDGTAVVYITHKLREVMSISDRVTVMRRGQVVESCATTETDIDKLALAMIGTVPPVMSSPSPHPLGDVVAHLRGISVAETREYSGITDIELEIRAGEVVGVAGVIGNGQEALAGVLTGLLQASAGTIDPAPEVVAYVPEDRARDGLANTLSIADNAIVHRHRDAQLRSGPRLNRSAIARFTRELVDHAGIHIPHLDRAAGTLSGGNQQKLVLSRELEADPRLIVAHNPYRGLDVGATADVRQRLLDARDGGAGVVVISPDLDDLFGLADRLVVLFEGRIVGRVDPRATTAQELGRMMAGVE
jgi:simple sugar transport system ATP-binding protein